MMIEKEQVGFQSGLIVEDEVSIGRYLNEAKATGKKQFKELKKEVEVNFSKDRIKRAMGSATLLVLGATIALVESLKLSEINLLTNKKIDENEELIKLRQEFVNQRITIEEFKEKYKLLTGKQPKTEYEKFLGHLKSMEDKVMDIDFPDEDKGEIKTKINLILGCIE